MRRTSILVAIACLCVAGFLGDVLLNDRPVLKEARYATKLAYLHLKGNTDASTPLRPLAEDGDTTA